MEKLSRREEKILDFITKNIDEDLNGVKKFVSDTPVSPKIQDELLENYPATLLKIADVIILTEDVTMKMIRSKKPSFLKVILKKQLSINEQLCLVECCPEKIREHQEFLEKNEDETYGCLFPSTEKTYRKAKKRNPQLPNITYHWC